MLHFTFGEKRRRESFFKFFTCFAQRRERSVARTQHICIETRFRPALRGWAGCLTTDASRRYERSPFLFRGEPRAALDTYIVMFKSRACICT